MEGKWRSDKEKVIKGITCCLAAGNTGCEKCPYLDKASRSCGVTDGLLIDARELLKAQETVVRCKDCKYYEVEDHYGNFHGYKILAASDVPTCHRWVNDTCMVKPDGYCFLAERR